jgi:two-component system sensor histidine kinase BaeS
MFNTLRRRLVISHALPLLVIIPLMGLALVYALETQVLLPNLSSELVGQARLVAEITSDHTDIWNDPSSAQALVARISPRLKARLALLDSSGHLLASSDPADTERLGQLLVPRNLAQALTGQTSVDTNYNQSIDAEVANVLVPIAGPDQRIVGIVYLTHRLSNVYEWFLRLRYLTTGILASGLLLGAILGWVLALNLERPLQHVTQAIYRFSNGQPWIPVPEEQGPDEIRLLSQAFNTLVERLHTLEQNRRQLLANLVHEVGRPIGALHSAIQALVGGADEEMALRRELLVGMDGQLANLRRLLDDLTRFYDQAEGAPDIRRRPVALGEWLLQVLAPWKVAAQQKGLRWEADIGSELPVLNIDPDRLGQALGNLLSNAIKYTPAGGKVSIATDVKDNMTQVQVRDTGVGITPEEQARVFMPFYRGQTGRRFPQGMGLGLSIVRDLIIAHGGRLDMDSAPGQGSCFTICLPVS